MMNIKAKTVKIKVFRFDPSVDQKPYYDEFNVPYDKEETILGALHFIRENRDSSLAYRDSCETGCCAICSVRINGKVGLACKVKMLEEDMILEPVKKDKVLRDLAMI